MILSGALTEVYLIILEFISMSLHKEPEVAPLVFLLLVTLS